MTISIIRKKIIILKKRSISIELVRKIIKYLFSIVSFFYYSLITIDECN
jgi:hypothetical protein